MKADSAQITRLLKTARGQLDGILRMVEQDKYCMDISNQLLACEAILKKANKEILRCHMESCVLDAFDEGSPAERSEKVQELIALISKMS